MTAETTKLARLNDAVWFRLPASVRRAFPGLALLLTDGISVSAWPQVGGALPLVILFIGFFTGALFLLPTPYAVPIFSSSIPLTCALIGISSLGAGPGLWLFVGYVLGDLCILRLVRVLGTDAQFGKHGWADVGNVAVIYGLLAAALIFVPFISRQLGRLACALPIELWNQLLASFGRRGAKTPEPLLLLGKTFGKISPRAKKWLRFPFDAAFGALFTGLLIYLWTQATPILIRSAYVWYFYPNVQDTSVDRSLIEALQNDYAVIVQVGAVCAVIRTVLEYLASGHSEYLRKVNALRLSMSAVQVSPNAARVWAGEVLRIILATLLLYGILEKPFNIVVTAIVLALAAFTRRVVLPHLSFWHTLMTGIPMILRIIVVVGGTYLLSSAMMQNRLRGHDFYPVLLPLWVCLTLAVFFFPERSRPAAAKASPEPTRESDTP